MDQTDIIRKFAALGDPVRLGIIEQLARGDATVQDLARPHAISAPAISRHLRVLEEAGLIIKGRQAQRRPCSLNREAFNQLAGWTGDMAKFWGESFDRMDAYIADLKQGKETRNDDGDKT